MEALSAVQMLSSVRCVCVRCVFTAPTHSPLLELEHTFSGQMTHFLCVNYWLNHATLSWPSQSLWVLSSFELSVVTVGDVSVV